MYLTTSRKGLTLSLGTEAAADCCDNPKEENCRVLDGAKEQVVAVRNWELQTYTCKELHFSHGQ